MNTTEKTSILKGPKAQLWSSREPITLHRIFENTVDVVEKISQYNNNEVKIIHSINIRESVAQHVALIDDNEQLSYMELNSSANMLARAIIKSLPKHSDLENIDGDLLIAVCMKPSMALVVTLLAIWKVGAAYLPLDSDFPEYRMKHILEESKPAMMIADDSDTEKDFLVTKYSDLKKMASDLPDHNLLDSETLKPNTPKIEFLGAVLYTSGSTGVPKGVRLSHTAILNRLKWQFKTFPYSATERVCAFKTALTFVDSICELWGPLLNARTILILSKEDTKDPERLTSLLEKYEVERLVLVPTLLQSILMYASMLNSKTFLRHLQLWICSGEILSIPLAKLFFDCFDGKSLCNFYGSTEVMGDVTFHEIRSKKDLDYQQSIPIGKPIDNCAVYILDEHLRPVPKDEVGELYVSGLNLASGYVRGREPDKFLENVVEPDIGHLKLYKTGDFARTHRNVIYYEGRKDCQIKVRGHRVNLLEIEMTLGSVKEIDKHIVLAYHPGEIDQTILAFVTVKEKITESEIEKKLKTLSPPYMVPQVIILDSLPLLINGKVDRQLLLKKYAEDYNPASSSMNGSKMTDYTGVPEDKIMKAEVLFDTVLNVLGKSLRNPISGNSNFYCLGGNSLNSVITVTTLQSLGYTIRISDFISSKNLFEIIDKMKEKCSNGFSHYSPKSNFKSAVMCEEHKKDVFEIITSSFYEKSDLERLLYPPVKYEDYVELMEVMWPHIVEKQLSFVALDSENNVKGAALNFDAFDEPEVSISPANKLNIIFEFLEFLEGPIREEKLPHGKNKVLHSFMMGSKTNLSPQETVEIFCFMEEEVLNFAKERNFEGILTSNTNPLTQQLGCDVNNYETLLNYQVNEFVASDGTKPFSTALDSQKVIVSWKKI